MTITISAIYEQGVLRPLKPLNLVEHNQVHVQILTDDAPSNEVSFSQCLGGLRQLLASLEQDWSNDLVRRLFPQLLRADLRALWHLCRPSQRELCAMLELAAAHLHRDSLTHEQIAAIRFAFDLLEREALTAADLNEAHERLTAAGLPPAFALDAETVQSYLDDL
ncbi:MAG: antitoxin family protein [Anaerolineae bacterium]